MDFIYTSPDSKWAIGQQGMILVMDGAVYSVYKKYPNDGWVPYKFIGENLSDAFVWLRQAGIISGDEMRFEVAKLKVK